MAVKLSYARTRRYLGGLPYRARILLGLLFLGIFAFFSFHTSPPPSTQRSQPLSRARNFHPNEAAPVAKPKLDDDWDVEHHDFKARPEAQAAVAALAGTGTDYGRAAEAVDEPGSAKAKGGVRAGGGTGGKAGKVESLPSKPKPNANPGLGPQGAGKAIPAVVPIGMKPLQAEKAEKAEKPPTIPDQTNDDPETPLSLSSPSKPLAAKGITVDASSPWQSIAHIFSFGDSWSYTAFDIGGTQPSRSNPFGNPALPENGISAPPEWLYYLTTTYNASFIKTYNIAHGAATIDRAVVAPHDAFSYTSTFKEQAEDLWRLVYKPRPASARWHPEDSLFTVWFGLNDIMLAFDRDVYSERLLNVEVIAAYAAVFATLYESGARQFLLLNAPPLDVAPGAPDEGKELEELRKAVEGFNEAVEVMKEAFVAQNEDASVVLFDVNGLLKSLMKEPGSMEQTSEIRNTTTNCWDYNPV